MQILGSTGHASGAEKVKAGQEAKSARDTATGATQQSAKKSCDWGVRKHDTGIHASNGSLSLITLFVSHEI